MAQPRPELVVDINALKRNPGVRRAYTRELETLSGVELVSADIVGGAVAVKLELEMVGDQVVATGSLEAAWTGPCRRCLEPENGSVTVDVHEIFEKVPVEGETYELEEETVDLAPMVREAIVLALPVAPLCRADCLGPAPDQFPTSTASESDDNSAEPAPDPRWAALNELTFEDDPG